LVNCFSIIAFVRLILGVAVRRAPGIQSKITVFIIVVIVSVLSVSTYISRTLTEQKAVEHLRERYINIVKQIDASIVTLQELRDTATLQEELAKLLQVRSNIVLVEIFDLSPPEVRMTARSGTESNGPVGSPELNEIEAVQHGEVITSLETRGTDRFWNILAPIRIKKEVAGLIRARISTREFDALVSQERRQALLVTATAALIILGFLVWYLRRTISQPVQRLVHAMAQAEAGNLQSQVQVQSWDELGRLALQFNQMLGKIRNFNLELQSRIQQATVELNWRYEELMGVNRRLYETQLQLAHSERLAAAGQVAATVAHRIGTPLHSILGHLYRLKRDTSAIKREERLKIIESQVERVVQVIQELLDTVRKPAPQMEPIQMNKLLGELLDLVMPGISLRGIHVETKFEPRLPAIIGDIRQLQEVFLNLLTNAMDAMPGGGELRVITGLNGDMNRDRQWIIVTVQDTGSGMADSVLPRIFEPFFTTKERSKGTGLGLSICREVIKAHSGEIQVSSRVGMGTIFTVTLPVSCDEAA
jgi:signal transduction histidine kinase